MAPGICGFSLQNNTLVLAIIDLVCEVIGTALFCVQLAAAIKKTNEIQNSERIPANEKESEYVAGIITISFVAGLVVLYFLRIILSIILVAGAARRSIKLCRIWFNVSAAILVLATLFIIFGSIFGSDKGNISSIITSVFLFLYKVYMLWVVHCFINFLRFNNSSAINDHAYDQAPTYEYD